jgi:hypothetical protein
MAARLEALQYVAPPRTATRPTAASQERRLDSKRRASSNKRLRQSLPEE